MSKRLLIALLIGVFLVSAGLGGFAADKVQITVWCQAFDPHVNGFDNQIWAIGIPDPPGDAGLVVNLDALKEAGLPQIAKFDDMDQLLAYATKLTKKEGGKIARSGLSFQESNDPNFFYSYIVGQGGKFWDNDKQKFTLQTPEAKKALQFFYDLFYKYEVDSTQIPDTMSALSQNLAAMGFMWPEFLPFAQNSFPDLNFDFIMKPPFVKGKPNVFSHTDTWNLMVPKYVKGIEKDATFKFVISEEGQLLFLDANPGLSPLTSLVYNNNDYYKTGKGKYLAPVIAAIKAGAYRFRGPFIDADTMLYNIMWPNMDALIHKQVTTVSIDGVRTKVPPGGIIVLAPGDSVCLPQRLYHKFWGREGTGTVLVGEVSRVNDDYVDNKFFEKAGRFPTIEEDEPPLHLLYDDYRKYYRYT